MAALWSQHVLAWIAFHGLSVIGEIRRIESSSVTAHGVGDQMEPVTEWRSRKGPFVLFDSTQIRWHWLNESFPVSSPSGKYSIHSPPLVQQLIQLDATRSIEFFFNKSCGNTASVNLTNGQLWQYVDKLDTDRDYSFRYYLR